jgi:CBS domain-containing protein
MRNCRSVMTELPTVSLPSDTIDHVAQLMRNEDVGSIPIVDNPESRRLVGIVTDRDIAMRVVADGRDPKSVTADEIMSRDLQTCQPETNLEDALNAMERHQIRRIPVVEGDRRLVGIIAQADIARRVGQAEKTAELVEEVSKP